MELCEVLNGIEYTLISGDLTTQISSVEFDSRKVTEGSLFICITGFTVDGHSFARASAEKGAAAIVIDSGRKGFPDGEFQTLSEETGVTVVSIRDTHKLMADICANFREHPENRLSVYGITGTKGKTTTAFMLKAILEEGGMHPGLVVENG